MPATIEATRRETLTSNTFRTPATPGEPAGAGGSKPPAPAAIVASVRLRLEQQLLHAPVRGLGDVDFILRRAGELVAAGKFLEVASRPADHAQHLALERQLEDAAGEGRLAEKEHLVRVCAGRNAERVRRADRLRQPRASRGVAVGGDGARLRRHINGEHALEGAVGVEHLDATVGAVADVDVVIVVDRDGVRGAELSLAGALRAPRLHPAAAGVDLGDARVDVAIADVDV